MEDVGREPYLYGGYLSWFFVSFSFCLSSQCPFPNSLFLLGNFPSPISFISYEWGLTPLSASNPCNGCWPGVWRIHRFVQGV